MIQLQSVSESPISAIIIKLAVIVLSVDLSDENAVVSKFPHYLIIFLYISITDVQSDRISLHR